MFAKTLTARPDGYARQRPGRPADLTLLPCWFCVRYPTLLVSNAIVALCGRRLQEAPPLRPRGGRPALLRAAPRGRDGRRQAQALRCQELPQGPRGYPWQRQEAGKILRDPLRCQRTSGKRCVERRNGKRQEARPWVDDGDVRKRIILLFFNDLPDTQGDLRTNTSRRELDARIQTFPFPPQTSMT